MGDRSASDGMAAFATLSTMIAFMGPPLFGVSAEFLGLQTAFALFIPLPLIAIVYARYLADGGAPAGARKDEPATG